MSEKTNLRHDVNNSLAGYRIREFMASRLRDLREEANYTQKEVAEGIGRTQAQVSRYENGERLIPAEDLARIARLFQIPIQRFYPPDLTYKLNSDEISLINSLRREDYPGCFDALNRITKNEAS